MKKSVWSLVIVCVGSLLIASGLQKVSLPQVVKRVAQKEKLSQKKTHQVIQSFLEEVRKELKAGRSVTIRGFGTFYVATLKARKWKHPKTKEVITLKARRTVRFRPSLKLKQLVNGEEKVERSKTAKKK